MEQQINFPFLVLLESHIEVVTRKRVGWLSNRELFFSFNYCSARLIDATGALHEIENIRLGGIKLIGLAHILNMLPVKRAPRSVEFENSFVSHLTFSEIKSIVTEHIKDNSLFARPDYGAALGKFYDIEKIEAADNFMGICNNAKMSMNRKYMKLFYSS